MCSRCLVFNYVDNLFHLCHGKDSRWITVPLSFHLSAIKILDGVIREQILTFE